MNLQEIYGLIDKLSASGVNRLELSWQGASLVLDKTASGVPVMSREKEAPAAGPRANQAFAAGKDLSGQTGREEGGAGEDRQKPEAGEAGVFVKAPLVGTFYQAPGPEAEPFVKPGQKVAKGQTICSIEAMKVINEIPAPRDGVILEILAEDGALVGFEAPLFRLGEPSDV